MGLYPYNGKIGQTIQTDANNVSVDRGFIAHFIVADPVAADTDGVLALTALSTEVQTITADITDPDYPRALQIDSDSTGATGNVVVTGTDYNGDTITETITLNGTTAVAGNKAFKTVTEIELPVKAGTEQVSVGVTDKLGLPYKLPHNTVLKTLFNDVVEGTAPTVATSSTELASNTIDLNSALDGSKVDVYLIV